MTYYLVLVEKEDVEYQEMLIENKVVQICMSEEEAIGWIKGTDANRIVALAMSLDQGISDLYVHSVEEDKYVNHSHARGFYTREAISLFDNDDPSSYRYMVWIVKFDNESGLSSIRHY